MFIQLADKSTWLLTGVMEDILIKVGEFIYTVDFVVLETLKVGPCHSRTSFLSHNALISCKNCMMRLSFGNMTLELNIFSMQR